MYTLIRLTKINQHYYQQSWQFSLHCKSEHNWSHHRIAANSDYLEVSEVSIMMMLW